MPTHPIQASGNIETRIRQWIAWENPRRTYACIGAQRFTDFGETRKIVSNLDVQFAFIEVATKTAHILNYTSPKANLTPRQVRLLSSLGSRKAYTYYNRVYASLEALDYKITEIYDFSVFESLVHVCCHGYTIEFDPMPEPDTNIYF